MPSSCLIGFCNVFLSVVLHSKKHGKERLKRLKDYVVTYLIIVIIMVIFKCYFSREHIALSLQKRCEHRIRKTNRLRALCIM